VFLSLIIWWSLTLLGVVLCAIQMMWEAYVMWIIMILIAEVIAAYFVINGIRVLRVVLHKKTLQGRNEVIQEEMVSELSNIISNTSLNTIACKRLYWGLYWRLYYNLVQMLLESNPLQHLRMTVMILINGVGLCLVPIAIFLFESPFNYNSVDTSVPSLYIVLILVRYVSLEFLAQFSLDCVSCLHVLVFQVPKPLLSQSTGRTNEISLEVTV
jgi:hypothetical protein